MEVEGTEVPYLIYKTGSSRNEFIMRQSQRNVAVTFEVLNAGLADRKKARSAETGRACWLG
jgi:hypothetical protein